MFDLKRTTGTYIRQKRGCACEGKCPCHRKSNHHYGLTKIEIAILFLVIPAFAALMYFLATLTKHKPPVPPVEPDRHTVPLR